MSSLKVANEIYNCLYRNNVSTVFLYTGGAIMGLIDNFHIRNNKYKIKSFISSNEQNLMAEAIGYARTSGKPATVIVTSGPGILNCTTHMFDAYTDGVPLVVFGGQVPISEMNKPAFQAAPSIDVMRPITKKSILLKSTNKLYINTVINTAYDISMKPKTGPVFIDIPKCILGSDLSFSNIYVKKQKINNSNNNISAENIKKLKNIFLNDNIHYKKPLIIIGKGCSDASNEVREFSIKHKIPVTNTLHGAGIFDDRNFLSLKMHGMHGNPAANLAIQESDFIMAFGNRFDDRSVCNVRKYAPKAKTIMLINNDKKLKCDVKPTYILNETCKTTLKYILKNNFSVYKNEYDKYNWLNTIMKLNYRYKYGILKNSSSVNKQTIYAADVLYELNKQLHNTNKINKTQFISGVGNHQMLTTQYIKFTRPNQLLTSGSLGVMGCAIPYGIGSKIANPNNDIIIIDGDGNFNMSLNDLKTAMTYNIPIKVIVFNNSSLNMVRSWENLFYSGNHTATDLSNPDFCKIARAYNFKSLICENSNDIEKSINTFINYKGSILLNVISAADEICYPMVKPTDGLDKFVV